MTAPSFIWDPAGPDTDLSSAATALKAGMTAPARELLARTRQRSEFDRRAYASAVLATVVSDLNLAETWAEEEPDSPDAWLLWARVAAQRAVKAKARDPRQLPLVQIAERACRGAAARCEPDPTAHVIALSLDRLGYRDPVAPPAFITRFGIDAPGPWDRLEEVMLRHPYNREAGQHLLAYFTMLHGYPRHQVRALGRWAATSSPRESALQLLPFYADVEFEVEGDGETSESAEENKRRTETLRVLIEEIDRGTALGTPIDLKLRRQRLSKDLAEALDPQRVALAHRRALTAAAARLFDRWFGSPGSMPYLPVRDLSVLVHALHVGGDRRRAGAVLKHLGPHAHTFPWSRETRNPAGRLREIYEECGVSPPHG